MSGLTGGVRFLAGFALLTFGLHQCELENPDSGRNMRGRCVAEAIAHRPDLSLPQMNALCREGLREACKDEP